MSPADPLNVLIYSGIGTTGDSVRHALLSIRHLLSPNYAVAPLSTTALISEPWPSTCALLVVPGGADLPYCAALNGPGNRRIAQYVRTGGSYLGFCAGGYYASSRVEFEVDDRKLAVVGSRELKFFPGTCRGASWKGFEYSSENGARAADILVEGEEAARFKCYFNGGGVFVDAAKFKERGVEILARYADELDVDGGEGGAAVVYCKFGDGAAILTGAHPEFAGSRLSKLNGGMEYAKLIDALIANDAKRTLFLASLLEKLGLKVASVDTPHPRLSGLHLTSIDPSDVADLVDRLQEAITTEDGVSKIVDGNDTFILSEDKSSSSRFSTKKLLSALEDNHDAVADLNQVPTRLKFHTFSQPSDSETPSFSHKIFYTALLASRKISRLSPSQFGTFMLYGSIVTSTNTMLDKNQKLLSHLPSGLTFTATTQTDGRGRGSNVWISPPGSLIFSTLVRHSHTLNTTAPVVFIQYLVALATVRAIKTYAPSTFAIPVRLKWPNDIYALNPSTQSYTKIGGVLVNSSFSGHEFNLVVGVGINVSNAAPSLSLNALSETHFEPEKLLARILVVFEEMYLRFCLSGWVAFEDMYYKEWLHTGQVVTLEMEGGIKARILGVTREWGMLKVQELDGRKTWELMSDGNSFDFFKGLLKRKSG